VELTFVEFIALTANNFAKEGSLWWLKTIG
jgi:hypothetical protein